MLEYWPGSSAQVWTGCKSAQGSGWESFCAKSVHLHGWNMQSHYSKNTLEYDLLFSRMTWHNDRILCENKQASHNQKTSDVFYHHQRCYNNGKMLLLRSPAVRLVWQMTPAHVIYTMFWVDNFLPLSHSQLLLVVYESPSKYITNISQIFRYLGQGNSHLWGFFQCRCANIWSWLILISRRCCHSFLCREEERSWYVALCWFCVLVLSMHASCCLHLLPYSLFLSIEVEGLSSSKV